jgi:hypothetical protein
MSTEPMRTIHLRRDHCGDSFTIQENTRIPSTVSGKYVLTAQRTDRETVYVGMSRDGLIALVDALSIALGVEPAAFPPDEDLGDGGPESILLHGCGRPIPVGCESCGETFTVGVHQFPDKSVDVVLTSQAPGDDDVLKVGVRWDIDADDAEDLGHQLLHHAAVARDFKAQVN